MSELSAADPLAIYGRGLRQGAEATAPDLHALGDDGSRRRLPLERWLRRPEAAERRLLRLASGPVLDVGCGAGRHVIDLRRRGVEAVGVELSRQAAAIARERGAVVIEGSIFDQPLPGGWATALLLDGNIGIGGEPAALLRRVAALLSPGGAALVELEPPRASSAISRVRLEGGQELSEWIPWRLVGVDEIGSIAAAAELVPNRIWTDEGRWFARLCGAGK